MHIYMYNVCECACVQQVHDIYTSRDAVTLPARSDKLDANLSTASLHGCIVTSATDSLASGARSRKILPTSSPMHCRICFSVSSPALRMASHDDAAAPRAPMNI